MVPSHLATQINRVIGWGGTSTTRPAARFVKHFGLLKQKKKKKTNEYLGNEVSPTHCQTVIELQADWLDWWET